MEQDLKLYFLSLEYLPLKWRMGMGSQLQGNHLWGSFFPNDSYPGLGLDIMGGGRRQRLFPIWDSLAYLSSKNDLLGGVDSSSPPASIQAR